MKIPFDNPTYKSGLYPVSRDILEKKGLQKKYGAESESFSDLFKRMADRIDAPPTEEDPPFSSLTADEALALSQRMTLQINESLLAILSDQGGDHEPRNAFMDGFEDMLSRQATGPGEVSRIRQVPSRIDIDQVQDRKVLAEKDTEALSVDEHGIEGIIQKAAQTFGVDSELIKGVIQAESSFNPDAISPKGALGLMQLMPETARELGVKDPLNPVENVMGGTRYLKKLLDRYEGSTPLALAAYNWGMGNLDSRRNQMPAETRNYVAKITGITLT